MSRKIIDIMDKELKQSVDWFNSMNLEQQFYKTIQANEVLDHCDRTIHPNTLTTQQIKYINIMSKTNQNKTFGKINASRISGGNKHLFGSNITHNNFIELTISSASISRKHSEDRIHAQEPLIKIQLSQVQFAQLLTNMNTTGVPCTITYTQEDGYIWYEGMQNRLDLSREQIVNQTQGVLEERTNKMYDLISESRLSKKDKQCLFDNLQYLTQTLQSNVKFYQEEFQRNADNIVTEAKSEIEAFRQQIILELGVESLQELVALKQNKNNQKSITDGRANG